MGISITSKNHIKDYLKSFSAQAETALEAVGTQAETYAKQNVTAAGRVDTGAMRNSINHKVVMAEKAVYIGTNQDYAIYHELGTGIYTPGGRRSPWAYQDENGEWHQTRGVKPVHMIKKAAEDHANEYLQIIDQTMKGK